MTQFAQPRSSIPPEANPPPSLSAPRPLIEIPRTLRVEDVSDFNRALAKFSGDHENNPHQFVFNDYYTWCSGGNSVSALELSTAAKRVPKQGFERFEVGAFNSWRTSLLNNTAEVLERRSKLEPVIATLRTTKEPTTLEELRELYRKHPTLNDFSPVQYQDCPGEYAPKGNFVHVSTDRLSLYKTEPPKVTHRIYLNPPLEEVPAVVSYLCDRAIKENQPIYLKFCDSSVDLYLLESTLKRGDGIVLFTDAVQAKLLLNYIEEARQEHPNWFRAGSVPRLSAEVLPGVGVAEEPNLDQKRLFAVFSDGVSFSSIRSKLLAKVYDHVLLILLNNHDSTRLSSGLTIRETVVAELEASRTKAKAEILDRRLVPKLWLNLDSDIIYGKGRVYFFDYELMVEKMEFSQALAVRIAVEKTLHKILPQIRAEVLFPLVQQGFKKHAASFLVDPNNLALNLAPSVQ